MIDLQNESGRRWTTAALVGAALLSAAYWTEAALLRFRQGLPEAAVRAGAVDASASASQPLATAPPAETMAKLLGAPTRVQAAPLGPAERFKVMGVIASASGRGTALIAVDGQAPRPYSVGAELAPGFVLQSVSQKELTLAGSPGGAAVASLPLPEPGSAPLPNAGAASPSGSAGAADAPPLISGSRGNPRAAEPALPGTTPNSTPSPTPNAAPGSAPRTAATPSAATPSAPP